MARYRYPHTIDNGAGERLTFLGVRSDERGEYLEARNAVAPGDGPPMHVHHLQEEALTVGRGTLGYQLQGGEEATIGAGEAAFDAAYLSTRYRSEFELTAVPRPVRRLLLPIVAAAGRALGRHRRFAGAPEPVRRPAP